MARTVKTVLPAAACTAPGTETAVGTRMGSVRLVVEVDTKEVVVIGVRES